MHSFFICTVIHAVLLPGALLSHRALIFCSPLLAHQIGCQAIKQSCFKVTRERRRDGQTDIDIYLFSRLRRRLEDAFIVTAPGPNSLVVVRSYARQLQGGLKDMSLKRVRSAPKVYHRAKEDLRTRTTYNNDPDVFNIFRSEELAKIIRGTLFM